MTDYATWTNKLDIRIVGSGEFVKKECSRLVDAFEYAEYDRLQELRGDMEELAKDNFYER